MAETIQWSFPILRNNFSTSNSAKKHSSKSILHQTYSRSCITYSSKFFLNKKFNLKVNEIRGQVLKKPLQILLHKSQHVLKNYTL